MINKNVLCFLVFATLFCGYSQAYKSNTQPQISPNITVVFVVDQLGYASLSKYGSYLKYGIADLLKKGTVYHNALYPHAMPTTPTGHAAISTGGYANVHGFNSYGFIDENNRFVEMTDDDNPDCCVFGEDGSCLKVGRSAKRLMTDTVSDKFIFTSRYSSSPRQHDAAAFALKPRASIPLAGNLGKAFWLEKDTLSLTTSKFYYDTMPEWIQKFNKKRKHKDGKELSWKSFYSNTHSAYKFSQAQNYDYSVVKPDKLCTKKIALDYSSKESLTTYLRSPLASEQLFAAAKAYIRNNSDKKLLIYVSLSNFDYSGHLMGPDNFDQIDLLYHIDWQIGKFMGFVNNLFNPKRVLYVLTSDHGVSPIPEIQNKQGFHASERIDANKIIAKIDSAIEREFGYKNIVQHFEAPQFYLNRKVLDTLSDVKKNQIYQKIKEILFSYDAVLDVWSDLDFEKGMNNGQKNQEYRDLFLKQYVRGRSGNIVFLTYPNKMITSYLKGTSHYAPYRDNTHVPLIIYQRGKIERKQICEPVSVLSLATTQSYLMGILPPNTAVNEYLPGINLYKVIRDR